MLTGTSRLAAGRVDACVTVVVVVVAVVVVEVFSFRDKFDSRRAERAEAVRW